MRKRRAWALVLLLATGCSTHPWVDCKDFFKPGRFYPDQVTRYGGVCIRQGPGPIGTVPAIPPPVVPPPAPLPPPGGPIQIPNLPPPGSVVPVPSAPPGPTPFPVAP